MQKNEAKIFGKVIVIATGTTPIKSMLKNLILNMILRDIKASKPLPLAQ